MNVVEEFDKTARELGFENSKEMIELISRLDLSTVEFQLAFDWWKKTDGTKQGLLPLLKPIPPKSV